MKKVILFLVAAMICSMPTMAQKRTNGKTRTTQTARRTTATPTAQPVVIDEPLVVDGHIAFMGILLNQSKQNIESQLRAKGYTPTKDEFGTTSFKMTVWGQKVDLSVDSPLGNKEICVNWRELKNYGKSTARARVVALTNAILKSTGGKIIGSDMTNNSIEGGYNKIQAGDGYIEVSYWNDDEVNFDSRIFHVGVKIANYEL